MKRRNYKSEKSNIIDNNGSSTTIYKVYNKQISIKKNDEQGNPPFNNNEMVQDLNNQVLKEGFRIVIENEGIDLMNLKNTIHSVYDYLVKNNKSTKKDDYQNKIQNFVQYFFFCLLNWKFPNIEKEFGINEALLKILLKKHLFKFKYLKGSKSINEYKTNKNLLEQNYEVIFNVVKAIEYKYDICIVGIFSSLNKIINRTYPLNTTFIWLIKFIDYVIGLYLGQNLIMPFSEFLNNKIFIKKEIEKFDKENQSNINFYFAGEPSFVNNIIYVVENVMYHFINKKNI